MPSRTNPDNTGPVHFLRSDKPTIIGLFPNRQPGAGCAPSAHDVFIAPVAFCKPFQEIEDQSVHDGVDHEYFLPCLPPTISQLELSHAVRMNPDVGSRLGLDPGLESLAW
jgi:hypothetical protein